MLEAGPWAQDSQGAEATLAPSGHVRTSKPDSSSPCPSQDSRAGVGERRGLPDLALILCVTGVRQGISLSPGFQQMGNLCPSVVRTD